MPIPKEGNKGVKVFIDEDHFLECNGLGEFKENNLNKDPSAKIQGRY